MSQESIGLPKGWEVVTRDPDVAFTARPAHTGSGGLCACLPRALNTFNAGANEGEGGYNGGSEEGECVRAQAPCEGARGPGGCKRCGRAARLEPRQSEQAMAHSF